MGPVRQQFKCVTPPRYRHFVTSHFRDHVQLRGMTKLAFLPVAALLLATSAQAQSLEEVASLDIIPGWQTADGTQIVGLRITLQPGWKTYWRAPGDGGIPPQISFDAGTQVAAAQFHWPVPEVFDQNGVRSIGYDSSVVLPLEFQIDDGEAFSLSGTLDIGVCKEVCVPVSLPFDTAVAPTGGRDPAILAALLNRPLSAAEASVASVTCRIMPSDDGISLSASITMPGAAGTQTVVIETNDPLVWVSEPDVTREGDVLTATSDLVHVSGEGFLLDRSGVRITVLGRGAAVDIQGCNGS